MPIDLFSFLPWSPQDETSATQEFQDGYASWASAARALKGTIQERLGVLYYETYDADMKPRPLSSLDSGDIAGFLDSCKSILDSFDGTVLSDCLRIPALTTHPAERGIESLDWGLCGAVTEIAQIKYLQGRHYVAENKLQNAWDCAMKLHRASSLCFQAGNSDVYLTGMSFRHHCLLLLYEIVGHGGSTSIARKAIGLALSTPDLDHFALAFLAPLAFRAIEYLKDCSTDLPIEDALRTLVQRFVDTEREDGEADLDEAADMSIPDSGLCSDLESFQAASPFATTTSPTVDAPRPLRLESTAKLVGFVLQRCLEALNCPAHAARKTLTALLHSCLPDTWPDEKNWQTGELVSSLSNIDNAIGLLFVSKFAEALCAQVRRNGFFWYYPLAQHRGIATALSVHVFNAEQGSRPHYLEEIVQHGIMSVVPVDPFSGEKLLYNESEDMVLGELGEHELRHWVPPVDVSRKLRWSIPAGKELVGGSSGG